MEVAKQQEMQQQKDLQEQRVVSLLIDANLLMQPETISKESLKQSEIIYKEIASINQDDPRTKSLKKDINEGYARLANSRKSSEQYQDAVAIVDQGLNFDSGNTQLSKIKDEVQVLQAQADVDEPQSATNQQVNSQKTAKEEEVPFIGTF